MGFDKLVGLCRVQGIGDGPVFEGSDMVEGVVAHLMAFGHDLIVKVVIAQHVFAHHEESSLGVKLAQGVENERGRCGNGPVVEREINRMLVGIHAPQGGRVKPAEPFGRLLYKHIVGE